MIKGTIVEKDTKYPVDSVCVKVCEAGSDTIIAWTDTLGSFKIRPLEAGTYTVLLEKSGYLSFPIKGVIVSENKCTYLSYPAVEMTRIRKGVRLIPAKD